MLIKCPECELQVSDKARSCPHCGYPMNNISPQPSKPKQTTKRMRLPNGFGQISYIDGKLRNHYRAMVTVGKNEFGKPIRKMLKPQAYFPTYNAAYEALMEYNKHPYDLDDDITAQELYDKWTSVYFKTFKVESSTRNIKSAWSYCSSTYNMRAKDIRAKHIKFCMDSVESPNIKSRIKSVFNLMLDYALENEIVDKNYARTFNLDNADEIESSRKPHIAFTSEELEILWNNITNHYVKLILIQTYTGLRPQELCIVERDNIDFEKNIIVCGMKTETGIDRIVPIHPLVLDLVKEIYEESAKYNFSHPFYGYKKDKPTEMTYDMYYKRFMKIIKALNLNPEHSPHDPRKTYVTLGKKYNMDEYAIKMIVGHKIDDITEKIYTERDKSWLMEETKKIKKM